METLVILIEEPSRKRKKNMKIRVVVFLLSINIALSIYIILLLALSVLDVPVPMLRIHFLRFLNYYIAVFLITSIVGFLSAPTDKIKKRLVLLTSFLGIVLLLFGINIIQPW
jgi:hypothetical protein